MKIAIWITAASLLVVFYLAVTAPPKPAVGARGQVIGLENQAREFLQGRKFWQQQVVALNVAIEKEIQRIRDERINEQKMNAQLRQVAAETDKLMESLPGPKPSPAQRVADDLRAQADQIEALELRRMLEEFSAKQIREWRDALEFANRRASELAAH
ncbi:MAG: hypothetical protein ING75_03630 [Rhodocyclaceae bacterium]|nr:hypothetical protein [Rhodocyclaceae bacterium]